MFINNLFFFHSFPEVCNYADHNTFFIGDRNLGRVFFNINSDLSDVIYCFKINPLKANPDKFRFKILVPNKNYFNISILTGKKHRQIKLSKNKVVTGKTPLSVAHFAVTILFVLTLASDMAVLYGNDAFSILVRSTKKRYSSFLRKFSFSGKSVSKLKY